MNRIQSPPQPRPAGVQASSEGAYSARYTPSQPRAPFALFAPLHYEANYAYPLVVWLHGPGDDEGQLRRIMPFVSMRNYVAVAPQATRRMRSKSDRPVYCWRQQESDILLAEQRILESIDIAARKLNIREDRVFLGGFDCGGTMAYRVAMRQPRRFAGVLSLGGPFPTGGMPLGRLNETRRLPLFVACGRDSVKYPADQVCADLRLFHAAGMNVALRQYPCGQELTTQMLSDLDRWIMEQIAPAAEAS